MKARSAHLVVENLAGISAAYSEGLAARVLCEVWHRCEDAAEDGCIVETKSWGVTLRTTKDWSDVRWHQQMERMAVDVGLKPLKIDSRGIVVGLSFETDELACGTRPINVDPMKYRMDMAAASLAYSALAVGGVNFVEQSVVHPQAAGCELYRERLLRLIDADGCILMPGTYLPALERLGVSRAFNWSVVRDTIDMLHRHDDLVLGCNISGLSVSHDPWWHAVIDDLAQNPDVARRLVIEITETALPHDLVGAFNLVSSLQRTGCRVAVDDFGAGSSTLAFVRTIGADILKVDGSYVRRQPDNHDTAGLLRHLIQLAKHFAGQIVVEGVESETDLVLAREAGADWYQGFYLNGLADMPSPIGLTPARLPMQALEGLRQ
ncbi:EAL domain-containing protein [Rhizobium sp. FY34]|uniref:EAL domain-containing protein n=1 Tax=Rhizobium sp. FY34 TaxID=2562309 RepID=UPI0014852BD1|nr:EAL domain-containing protein [Rhizobium sp. FY34]